MLAILDPFSGIAGDMCLGALVDLGLEETFLTALPATLGLEGVSVRIARTSRCHIGAVKVDFDIPPQPHGRHLKQLVEIVNCSPAPESVKSKAADAFRLIATVEAEVHNTTVERVHLHEVGAVDAILDVVGTIWGFEKLGVTDVRCGPISLGDGFVDAAHGRMPVPAPATARILEGLVVSPGPANSGELTTPTGAALVRVLSNGPAPSEFVPRRSGYGAGTREFADRANVLRVYLADAHIEKAESERLVLLSADIDDMSPERLAIAAEELRAEGALDVTLTSIMMKKGRPGTRFEVLAPAGAASHFCHAILMKTSSIGVRETAILRHALRREQRVVSVAGHDLRVKIVRLPDGTARAKPESDDVRQIANATGMSVERVTDLAREAARQELERV